jgi:hypothetical protein
MVPQYAYALRHRSEAAVPMNRRMSTGRRILLVVVALIGMLAWTLGLITWTAFGRASTTGGFADITIETIQSPAGVAASSSAIVAQADAVAKAHGSVISAAGNAALSSAVAQVLAQPELGSRLGAGIDTARQALADRPDGGITIDVGSLRQQIVDRLQGTNPQLVAQIPPANDLTITVSSDQVPSAVSSAATILAIMAWTPVWLILATIIFLGIGFLITDDRSRTARHVGVAFIVLGIIPIVMRLIIPPLVGSAGAGNTSDIIQVATTATVANWWIALVITLVIGGALLALGIVRRRPSRTQAGPVVLGR